MGIVEQKIDRQRTDEWEEIDASSLAYHALQWESPKQSTLAFERFVSSTLSKSKNVIDLGAGAGAATAYLANKNPAVEFTAFDYSIELTELGKNMQANKKINNLDFEVGDWYNLNLSKNYDGCMSLQTLSWLPDYRAPMIEIFQKINPDFLALTSLFYEGDITCRIEVEECVRNNRKSFYNIYSLPAIGRLCEEYGYYLEKYSPFNIDIDIQKPNDLNVMGTYTEKIATENLGQVRRLSISGPLLMNWYMVLIKKSPSNQGC